MENVSTKTTYLDLSSNQNYKSLPLGSTHPSGVDPKRNVIGYSQVNDFAQARSSQSDEKLHCADIKQYKCQSRSLYRTCGYPAANPKSNLVAFCNEMRVYLVRIELNHLFAVY